VSAAPVNCLALLLVAATATRPHLSMVLEVFFLILSCTGACVGSMLVVGIVWSIKPRRLSPSTSVVPVDACFVAVPVVSVIMPWCSHKLRVVRTCV